MEYFENRMAKFFVTGKFTDFSIILEDGSSIRAHRISLARKSDFFNALFRHNWEQREFNFPPHLAQDKDVVHVFFNRIYNIKTDNVSEDNVADLLLLADYFGFKELEDMTKDVLLSSLNVKNCMFVLEFAKHFPSLEGTLMEFVIENFQEVYEKNKDFAKLPFQMFKDIISSTNLDITQEINIWSSIREWTEADLARKSHLPQLLQVVRLGLITHSDCLKLGYEYNILTGDADFPSMDKIEDFQRWKHTIDSTMPRPDFPLDWITIRPSKKCAIVTGGWTQLQPSTSIEMYDYKNDMWFNLPVQLPGARAYHGCIEVNGKVYIIGGFDGTTYYKSLFCLDLASKKWIELPPMHFKRCYVSVVAHNGYIYVMGGYDGLNENRRLTACERFDPSTNQWTLMSNMKKSRSDASAVTHEGDIYIAGGFNGDQYLNSVERYSIAEDKWFLLKPMKRRRGGVGCAILNNTVYAIGGHDGHNRLRTMESFDISGGTESDWTEMPSMLTCRSNFGVCTIENQIVVAGGYEHPSTTAKCEWFDGDRWHMGQDMERAASALAMTCVSSTKTLKPLMSTEGTLSYLDLKRSNRIKIFESLNDGVSPVQSDLKDFNGLQDAQGPCFDMYNFPSSESKVLEDYHKIMKKMIGIMSSAAEN